jgi:hypothetical protein
MSFGQFIFPLSEVATVASYGDLPAVNTIPSGIGYYVSDLSYTATSAVDHWDFSKIPDRAWADILSISPSKLATGMTCCATDLGLRPFVWDGGEWVDQADAQLRGDLAANDGAKLIGSCASIAELRTVSGTYDQQRIHVTSYYDTWVASLTSPAGGGYFRWIAASAATDDGGSVIAVTGVSTGRWYREFEGKFFGSQFGIIGDWSGMSGTDNSSKILKLIQYSSSQNVPVEIEQANVGTTHVTISSLNGFHLIISGSVFNSEAKPQTDTGDMNASYRGTGATFKILNSDSWSITGDGYIDNRYREGIFAQTCNKFTVSVNIEGSNLNDNLVANYYRYCNDFVLDSFTHSGTSVKPATSYYDYCNNLQFWDCTGFKVTNFEVHDSGSDGVYIGSNCSDYLISNFNIYDNCMSGIQLAWSSFGSFPIRGVICDGVIHDNRADGCDVNNTSGSIVQINLILSNISYYNNGFNTDGTVTADGSGLGTFKNVSHFSLNNCHTVNSAHAGFYAYNCADWSVTACHIDKTSSTNNSGEGIYIDNCTRFVINPDVNVRMYTGMEMLKLYRVLTDGKIGGVYVGGSFPIPTPDATTTYTNVIIDGATIINSTQEIQGRIPFRNTKITSSVNGLRVFTKCQNCDITSSGGIALVLAANGAGVVGGKYVGSNSGIYISGYNYASISSVEAHGSSGPAISIINSIGTSVFGGNTIVADASSNTIKFDSACTNSIFFGNYLSPSSVSSLGGTFNIKYE